MEKAERNRWDGRRRTRAASNIQVKTITRDSDRESIRIKNMEEMLYVQRVSKAYAVLTF